MKNKIAIISVIAAIIAIVLTSCEPSVSTDDAHTPSTPRFMRGIVIENHTTTVVNLTPVQATLLKSGDKVWVDMKSHAINDTSNTAMLVILGDNPINPREYQIELENDNIFIYDGDRLVGTTPYDSTNLFVNVFLKDNL